MPSFWVNLGSIVKTNGTHHEELAEGDVWEDVVGLVLAAGDPTLLPEVRELVLQGPAGPQVQDELSGQGIIQEGVVHMGKQPVHSNQAKNM